MEFAETLEQLDLLMDGYQKHEFVKKASKDPSLFVKMVKELIASKEAALIGSVANKKVASINPYRLQDPIYLEVFGHPENHVIEDI